MDAYQAPLYKAARKQFLETHQEQIAKGVAKYPEPLNPDSWTLEELVKHALQENVDQMHYLTAVKMKLQNEKEQYRHHKGGIYTIMSWNGRHTETGEKLMIYEDQLGHVWARPYGDFFGKLPDGTPRFTKIEGLSEGRQ